MTLGYEFRRRVLASDAFARIEDPAERMRPAFKRFGSEDVGRH